jgi:pSer/pThr/pTyr-binding forkhead associated (FHA) protein
MNAILALIVRLILILLSYLFVGWIAFLIYSDLRNLKADRKSLSSTPITLTATIDEEIQEKTYNKTEVIIGRDPAADFPLQDERVSLRHCQIAFSQNQWWVEDLNSTNGVYLNGSLLKSRVVLMNRDQLQLGQVEINIKI